MVEFDVFLACPLEQPDTEDGRVTSVEVSRLLWVELTRRDISVFFAGHSMAKVETPSFRANVEAVERSSRFVLVTTAPDVSRSSIWIEFGIAVALRRRILILCPDANSLPLLARRALAPLSRGGDDLVHASWLGRRSSASDMLDTVLPETLRWIKAGR